MTTQPIESPAAMQEAVKKALRLYHKDSKEGVPFRALQLFQRVRPTCRNDRQATNQVLVDAMATLKNEHPEEARIIVSNHFDGLTMKEVAHKIGLGEAATYERKARGVEWLAEIIWESEGGAGDKREAPIENGLPHVPRPEEPVVGVERHVSSLWNFVSQAGPPYLFAFVGMGGIGKTTLAQVLLQKLWQSEVMPGAGWVSAKPSDFVIAGTGSTLRPALTAEAAVESLHRQIIGASDNMPFSYNVAIAELQAKLRSERYIIVIDNLETIEDLQTLLPLARTLVNPTKIIFTTRDSLYGSLDVHHYAVPELDEADALTLVKSLAANAGLAHLATLSDEAIRPIFDIVGGNPLALRLVVGQSHFHDLPRIMRDLTVGKGKAGEFYAYVFRRAWDNLDETARVAWLATATLPATGGTYEQWFRGSGLTEDELDGVLDKLVTLNLVDSCISTTEALYFIHSLTRTFLLNGIAGWS